MSFLTFNEIATKFNMTSAEAMIFANYAMDKHRSLVMNNPDVSASALLDQFVMKDGWGIRTIVVHALSRDDVKSNTELEILHKSAISAVATYLSEYNKANFEDFKTDMMLEMPSDEICARADFMSDMDTVGDIIDGLIFEEAIALLPELQK
jgi:hypothetical protein